MLRNAGKLIFGTVCEFGRDLTVQNISSPAFAIAFTWDANASESIFVTGRIPECPSY